ncbi:hypothetical protein C9Z51_24155 (plasmid) [Escherichia coli]|nr:hypothetical protein [Escherichia coli]EGO6601565.1 hypothetical protein [Escherichia coli]EGO6614344.1 hypothetical protein [Escherichia coli]EGO6629875.1 hypothetical protein [Escherichia coli]TJQ83582.1 hypothetical protein C9Z51_24155 [Escherichia coli]
MPFYFRKECPLNSGYLSAQRPPGEVHIKAVLQFAGNHFCHQAAGTNAVVRLRAAEGKLRPC